MTVDQLVKRLQELNTVSHLTISRNGRFLLITNGGVIPFSDFEHFARVMFSREQQRTTPGPDQPGPQPEPDKKAP